MEMTDRELLEECLRFLSDMHVMTPEWTISKSSRLHAKVSKHLAAAPDADDKDAGPVKLADGSVKNSTLKIAGKPFRCACGCNVFHQPDASRPQIYECNACETWFEGE